MRMAAARGVGCSPGEFRLDQGRGRGHTHGPASGRPPVQLVPRQPAMNHEDDMTTGRGVRRTRAAMNSRKGRRSLVFIGNPAGTVLLPVLPSAAR